MFPAPHSPSGLILCFGCLSVSPLAVMFFALPVSPNRTISRSPEYTSFLRSRSPCTLYNVEIPLRLCSWLYHCYEVHWCQRTPCVCVCVCRGSGKEKTLSSRVLENLHQPPSPTLLIIYFQLFCPLEMLPYKLIMMAGNKEIFHPFRNPLSWHPRHSDLLLHSSVDLDANLMIFKRST